MMRSKVRDDAIRLVSAKGGGDRRRLLLDLSSVGGGKCAFELRRSARAKHLRLVVNGSGLTVVAPRALSSSEEIERLLEPHKYRDRKSVV